MSQHKNTRVVYTLSLLGLLFGSSGWLSVDGGSPTNEQDLAETETLLDRNPDLEGSGNSEPLVLQGHRIQLRSVALDDVTLSPEAHCVDAESLTVLDAPDGLYCSDEESDITGLAASSDGECDPLGYVCPLNPATFNATLVCQSYVPGSTGGAFVPSHGTCGWLWCCY